MNFTLKSADKDIRFSTYIQFQKTSFKHHGHKQIQIFDYSSSLHSTSIFTQKQIQNSKSYEKNKKYARSGAKNSFKFFIFIFIFNLNTKSTTKIILRYDKHTVHTFKKNERKKQ